MGTPLSAGNGAQLFLNIMVRTCPTSLTSAPRKESALHVNPQLNPRGCGFVSASMTQPAFETDQSRSHVGRFPNGQPGFHQKLEKIARQCYDSPRWAP
jgi:hypothetical protein